MRYKVELELEDVYGGDGQVRYEPQEKVKLSRTRTKTTIKESIGIAVPVTTEEEIKEKKLEPVHTFRLDGDGTPMLRLGGAHGKFWGALKAAAQQLYSLGDEDFRSSYRPIVDMITVTPTWACLETNDDLKVDGIPQVLKGKGGGMIVQYFDVVPKTTVELTLMFPDAIEDKVRRLLDHVQIGTHLNKRRTQIRVLKITTFV